VNEKLGGMNCIVAKEHMQYIQKNRVMIFGADVNHARVGSMRPSFAAVAGSLDGDARKHAAVLQAQSPRLEIIQVGLGGGRGGLRGRGKWREDRKG